MRREIVDELCQQPKSKIFLYLLHEIRKTSGFFCHHPQVVDGRDSLQILRVAVNILNKQSQTSNKGTK
jgi:hypothetical protein